MEVFVVLALLLPVALSSAPSLPVDCADLYDRGFDHSGVYTIYPAGATSATQAYCDMGCAEEPDGGRWTVIQRRKDGTVNFYRGWDQYRSGFGPAWGEYWLGLQSIHLLTTRKKYELRVDMEDFEGAKVHVQYSSFTVGPEEDGYTLSLGAFKDGGGGDSLTHHNAQKFTTFDKDQDTYNGNCAQIYFGGWWYVACHHANPNGLYRWGSSAFGTGINWLTWKGFEYSLKAIDMKIRPVKDIM